MNTVRASGRRSKLRSSTWRTRLHTIQPISMTVSRPGCLPSTDIVSEVPHYGDLWDAVETQFAGAEEHIRFNEALRMLIDWLVTGLIEGTLGAVRSSRSSTVDDVRAFPERLVRFSEGPLATDRALKHFLRKHVYYTPP